MNYISETLKEGIKVHYLTTEKYKTNLVTVFLSVPLDKKSATKNALITSILRLGTMSNPTQEQINKKLEEMYGAEFNCGVDKIGETQILKFYIEVLDDNFLPQRENLLEQAINQILEIAFNPLIEEGCFVQRYIDTEKVNLKNIIESKINDKEQYAFDRCIEEMYKNMPYSVYKYGYVEDLDKITKEELYEQYKNIVNTAKIDIYVSGQYNQNDIKNVIQNNPNIQKLQGRNVDNIVNKDIPKKYSEKEKTIEEKMNVTQGKLVIGLDVNENSEESKYVIGIYNVILGASATSKLFQNVREKASLAYYARSNYVRQKNNLYIKCGIEVENYDKVIPIIYEQLDAMKKGDFSNEDMESAKKTFVSAIKAVQDEQDAEITYFVTQELSGGIPDYEKYIEKIQAVTKQQVQDMANKISVNTVYFLRN